METIGDAYMVVGGLPKRNNIHAECVANQALDMMHYCQQVKRPDIDENIVVSNQREREEETERERETEREERGEREKRGGRECACRMSGCIDFLF